jgi:mono/diheme cytochrome c family protein
VSDGSAQGEPRPRREARSRAWPGVSVPLVGAFWGLSFALLLTLVWLFASERHAEWRRHQADHRDRAREAAGSAQPDELEPHGIQQIWLPALGRVDRCTTCHLGSAGGGIADGPALFRPHSGRWLDTHRPDRFGCTTCHAGQGLGTTYRGAAHEPLPFWPDPMVSAERMEARCGVCHRERAPRRTYWLARGRGLIADRNCVGCHEIPGYEASEVRSLRLDTLTAKTTPAWLRAWLREPRSYLPKSRMPAFRLSASEIESLVAFLSSRASTPLPPAPAGEGNGDADRGAALFRTSRCVTCHEMEGRGGSLGPSLTSVAAKASGEWLRAWLRDPQALQPRTLMPRFSFSEGDVRDLAAWLVRDHGAWPEAMGPRADTAPDPELAAASRVYERRGCAGCHELHEMTGLARIGPRHTTIGERVVEPAPLLRRGRRVDLPNWIFLKLETPEAMLEGARMPSFRFEPGDAAAVTIALLSLREQTLDSSFVTRDRPVPSSDPQGTFGALVRRYRCLSCHQLTGRGGTLSTVVWDRIGSQYRREAIERFLRKPVAIRVDLASRMPQLGMAPGDAKLLAEYLSSVFRDDALERDLPVTPALVEAGREASDRLGCVGCHVIGDRGGYAGQELNGSGGRLLPGWTAAFVSEPQRWRPGSLHPVYELRPGEAEALAAYVLGLPARGGRKEPQP